MVRIESNATVQKYTLTKIASKQNPRNPFGKDISPLTLIMESFGPIMGVEIIRGDQADSERYRQVNSLWNKDEPSAYPAS